MKKIYNYAFKLVCIYVLFLSFIVISNYKTDIKKYNSYIRNLNDSKVIASSFLSKNDNQEKEESIKEEVVEEITDISSDEEELKGDLEEEISKWEEEIVEEVKEEKKEEEVKPITPPVEVVNLVDTSNYAVLKEEVVNISHYGHDCYGCTYEHTASGYYIGDGRIYYNDNTFGSVRIVAADDKYPLGTIIRLGYNGTKITAIVLDRGGAIGDNKNFQIDLLTHSNDMAYQLGIVNNATLEVLRLGY